jgi:hypothetical protein
MTEHESTTCPFREVAFAHATLSQEMTRSWFARRVLEIREEALGPQHLNVAKSLSDLADVLQDEGDVESAMPLYRRSVEICEVALGPQHPEVVRRLNCLAILLQDQGDVASALLLFRRALALDEASFCHGEHLSSARSPIRMNATTFQWRRPLTINNTSQIFDDLEKQVRRFSVSYNSISVYQSVILSYVPFSFPNSVSWHDYRYPAQ